MPHKMKTQPQHARVDSFAMSAVVFFFYLLLISLLSAPDQVKASALAPLSQNTHQASNGLTGSGFNNLDNLISDFLDDAGNRLKKSKLNSMRQIKPTLRFGRRSDPLMGPNLADELDMHGQSDWTERQLLAAALLGANVN